jgi:hypothetical protein
MNFHVRFISMLMITIFLSGCTVWPICDGTMKDIPSPGSKIVVWSNNPDAEAEAVSFFQKQKFKVIEKSRLQKALDEQKIRLSNTSEDESQVMRAGKIVGADSVVFVQVEAKNGGSASRSSTLKNLSVTIKCVDIETGEVIWSANSHYRKPSPEPDIEVIHLTRNALARGLCPDPKDWNDTFNMCDTKQLHGTGLLGFNVARKNSPAGPVLIITDIIPGFPADKAGLKSGDIVLSCNGIKDYKTILQFMAACKVDDGKQITYEVMRGDKILKYSPIAAYRDTHFLGGRIQKLFEGE